MTVKPPILPNQYQGVNAHLHSQWQATHEWHTFHDFYIPHLMAFLKARLIPMGYVAKLTGSLQIRRVWDDVPRRPRSDILLTDTDPQRNKIPTLLGTAPVLTLDDLMEDETDLEHPYRAVGIYEADHDDLERDLPVAWLEVLSPTNKLGKDREAYLSKRRLILEQGLVFVELDYLHESPPTFDRLPAYLPNDPYAFPYRVVVIDPRPVYRENRVYMQQFQVDEPLPTMEIPLLAGDLLTVDFNAHYQQCFTDAIYGYNLDYRRLPMNFDRYTPADQLRILRRMLTVIQAIERDADLSQPPIPLITEPESVESALKQLTAF